MCDIFSYAVRNQHGLNLQVFKGEIQRPIQTRVGQVVNQWIDLCFHDLDDEVSALTLTT